MLNKLTQWFFSLQDLESIILLCSLWIFKRRIGHLGAPQVALVVKNPPARAGDIRDMGSITGLGRSPRGGHGNPFLYFCLENPMGRGDSRTTVQGLQNQTQLKRLSTSISHFDHLTQSKWGNNVSWNLFRLLKPSPLQVWKSANNSTWHLTEIWLCRLQLFFKVSSFDSAVGDILP